MSTDLPGLEWVDDDRNVDWHELSDLYRLAPLGIKPAESLEVVFANSMFKTFAQADGRLVAAGRAIADGLDCAYLADVAVHPDFQGVGLGKETMRRLIAMADGHKKIILYANPGTERFYLGLGFLPMATAMGIWADRSGAIASGLLRGPAG